MLKKIIHAVFLYDGKRKLVTCFLALAFLGCVKNEALLFSEKTVPAGSSEVTEKVAFLTFDDGPSYITEKVLDTLKEEDVKATFFMIGEQITEDKEPLLKRMVEEGHLIGVHTYTHQVKEIYSSTDACIRDVRKTAERISEVTGSEPLYYRFPWGSANCFITSFCDELIDSMQKEGYIYFDWNVSAEDSVGKPSKQTIIRNVRKDYKKYQEPVILMHDSSINANTAEALTNIIEELKQDGYRFATIDKRSKPCQFR